MTRLRKDGKKGEEGERELNRERMMMGGRGRKEEERDNGDDIGYIKYEKNKNTLRRKIVLRIRK